ncbi:MAG: WYL domain-containing protein [Candidatus Omnitrophica bacterium]|nr:WYL domain-containing protein [Candidatus Omnitrophota bacterium]
MGLQDGIYTVLDVETTGLYPQYGHRICEIAALRIENGNEAGRFEQLIDPGREISRDAFKVNRITGDMLSGKPRSADVLPDFMGFIKDSVLVGYNTGFDLAFIESEIEAGKNGLNGYRIVDALGLARQLYPGLSSFTLKSVSSYLGFTPKVAHRAMADVAATWHVFREEMKELRSEGTDSLEEISWICQKKPFRRMTPGSPRVAVIQKAIRNKRPITIKYRSRWDNRSTIRKVTPMSMPEGFDHPYLVAYCHLRQAQRNFRLDCILEANIN